MQARPIIALALASAMLAGLSFVYGSSMTRRNEEQCRALCNHRGKEALLIQGSFGSPWKSGHDSCICLDSGRNETT